MSELTTGEPRVTVTAEPLIATELTLRVLPLTRGVKAEAAGTEPLSSV
ncbi:hypothetical protein BH20CHL7_BH20CHL7_15020 [soil metagenome]